MENEITRFEQELHWAYTPVQREDMSRTPSIEDRKQMLEEFAENRLTKEIEKYQKIVESLELVRKQTYQARDSLTLETLAESLTDLRSTFENAQTAISDLDRDNRYAQKVVSKAPKIYE